MRTSRGRHPEQFSLLQSFTHLLTTLERKCSIQPELDQFFIGIIGIIWLESLPPQYYSGRKPLTPSSLDIPLLDTRKHNSHPAQAQIDPGHSMEAALREHSFEGALRGLRIPYLQFDFGAVPTSKFVRSLLTSSQYSWKKWAHFDAYISTSSTSQPSLSPRRGSFYPSFTLSYLLRF